MNARWRAACTLAAALAVCVVHGEGPAVDPGALLGRLPPRVDTAVSPLEGVLAGGHGVDRWRLLVNDAVIVETEPGSGRSATPFRLGVVLRPGNNLVSIEALGAGKEAAPMERWSASVYRSDPEPTQFALLAAGDSGTRTAGHLDSIAAALVAAGVRRDHIVTVSDPVKFASTLGDLGQQARNRDQVLIYYSGFGRVSLRNSEPELLFQQSDVSVPVGNVIREASGLPGASLLLDIAYSAPPPTDVTAIKSQARIAPSAPWLRSISEGPIEVAYTNPAAGARSQAGFTDDFVREWKESAPGECKTFARIAQSVAAANAERAAAWPVFFTHGSASFLFCPPQKPARPQLSIRRVDDPEMVRSLRFVDVSLSRSTPVLQLKVDGVPLPVSSAPAVKSGLLRIPIGPGQHVIEARADAGDAPPVTGKLTCAGPFDDACAPARPTSVRWSPDLVAQIDRALLPRITSEASLGVSFVIGGDSSDVHYQIRNNGVVVAQAAVKLSARVLRRQIVQRIPLLVGTNNLALDVLSGTSFASSRVAVERRRSQAVRAVIVGVDAPKGAPPLAGAVRDARRVQALLLQYTDAFPRDLQMFTGKDATRGAVLRAIAGAGEPASERPWDGTPESAFLLYFAGYGTSVRGEAGAVTRCLVTADFDPDRPRETCLSTNEVASALDPAGRAIVIVDTSYDGPAGPGSRTYSSFQTADTTWRLTSGIDRPNRIFLVAAESNMAAYETADGGQFTQALSQVVRTRLDGNGDGDLRELSLVDTFDRARDATSAKTGRKQVPVIKGVLSEPFRFVRKTSATIGHEASSIERAARNDLITMRTLDRARLARAQALYEKTLAMDGADIGAQLGVARIRTLRGELAEASEVLEQARRQLTIPSPEHTEWLMVAADISMRKGDIASALAEAQKATATDPRNHAAAAQLGLLYGIAGDYTKSYDTLFPLLQPAAVQEGTLTEEERGRLLIHSYVAMRQIGKSNDADLLLKGYFAALKGTAWRLKVIYENPVVNTLLGRKDPIVDLGNLGVQTPWSHLVAQFFSDSDKYEQQLRTFLKDTEPFDPRNPSAFACQLHFYIGMLHQLNQGRTGARQDFERAIATGETAYPEYWMARARLEGGKR